MEILVVVDTEGIRDALTGADDAEFLEYHLTLPVDAEQVRKRIRWIISSHYASLARRFARHTKMMIFPKDEVKESMRFFMGHPPFTKKEDIEETYMADGKLINAEQLAEGYAGTCDEWFPDETPPQFEVWAQEVLDEQRRT